MNTIKQHLSVIALLLILTVIAQVMDITRIAMAAGSSASDHSSALSRNVAIPVKWGDIGQRLTELGVIDKTKFDALYERRGGLTDDEQQLIYGITSGDLIITPQNSGVVLNALWAFGLANENAILDKAEMSDLRYGGTGTFASTGGWTLSTGDAMDHYSAHTLISLTPAQQSLVERVSAGIYRPCCDNPSHFPDCNHGMAMLGLLELMAKSGMNEREMYRYALAVQRMWFPNEYATIDRFLHLRGSSIDATDPRIVLGKGLSSASGYRAVLAQLPQQEASGGSCGA